MACAALKLLVHLLANPNYGFHRDELLHLSAGQHLASGYFEFPPMIAILGRLAIEMCGTSLGCVRLLPTLAGVAILALCLLMARALGGGWRAYLIAGAGVLAFLPFYRNHTLFQPVAFDQLFWSLGFYLMILYTKHKDKNLLLLLAVVVGLGILTKYTMLLWLIALLVSMFGFENGRIFRNRWLYLSGLLCLLVVAPNLLWQIQNDFPLLTHISVLNSEQFSEHSRLGFLTDHLTLFSTFLLSILGLWYISKQENYRWIAISTILIFLILLVLRANSYYAYPIYPVLFAAGAIQCEQWLKNKKTIWSVILALSIVGPFVMFIPDLAPLLPIEKYIEYRDIQPRDGVYELEGDYADMHGWHEQVATIDSVYRSLSPYERSVCSIWAENYGEAGAIKMLGDQYGLPDPISSHGSFWLWGSGSQNTEIWLTIGVEESWVESRFAEVKIQTMVNHPYAIAEEQNIPVYLCRAPREDFHAYWQGLRSYVFD